MKFMLVFTLAMQQTNAVDVYGICLLAATEDESAFGFFSFKAPL
jgi:hypothetical protein